MMHCSVEPRDHMLVKNYGFLSFAKNISKKLNKNLSCKYSPGMLATCQKLLDHAKNSSTDVLKISSKRAEPTGDLIGNKIADKTTHVSRTSTKYTSVTAKNETGKTGFGLREK